MTNLLGHSLGRYHILEQLGQGGMATVYKAYDTRLERDVAVKVLRTELFGQAVLERLQKRFEREAKALAKLSHSNIVEVYDYGEYEGQPYLVMKYLPGGTLKQRLKDLGRPMPWQDALRLLLPIARALDYAHQHNILHRDVKPSNILLTEQGEPMLTDFGIAKILDLEDGQTLTATGVGVGTPEYMSPEQGLGKPVDARTDVYSLGVVLYEMVTGRKPFVADTPIAVVLKQATEPLPRPTQFAPGLPEAVEKILLKALAKQPEDRYGSMAEMAAAIEKAIVGQQPAESRPQPVDRGPSTVHRPPSIDEAATIDQGATDEAATVDQGVTGETVLQDEDRRLPSEPPPSTLYHPPSEPAPIRPRWRAVVWISLGWAVGGAIGWAIGMGWAIDWEIGWAIGWAIGGLITALVLRKEKILSSWKSVFWITLGWAIGWAIGIGWAIDWEIGWAIGWAIGGLITALVLRKEKVLSSWKSVFWITLSWAIGGVIAWGIAWGIEGAIGGAIGGLITALVLRKEQSHRQTPTTE